MAIANNEHRQLLLHTALPKQKTFRLRQNGE
jgi:hypothetical protein